MSPIVIKDANSPDKIVYKGDSQDFANQIRFPRELEVVPPVQFRLWSLHEMALQKLN